MVTDQNAAPEFARPVDLTRVAESGTHMTVEASPAERAALAQRFGLSAVDLLRAELELKRIRGGAAVRLSGRLMADITQSCVVTLEPVKQHVDETFEILYSDEVTDEQSTVGADVAWPEPLPDGALDVGEAVAGQLSLALDPYPRAAGVALEKQWTGEGDTAKPFAALDKLRKPSDSSGSA